MLKKVFEVVESKEFVTVYRIQRNYKNGNSKFIGRPYKTKEGARSMARHRNSLHLEKYGTDYVRLKWNIFV